MTPRSTIVIVVILLLLGLGTFFVLKKDGESVPVPSQTNNSTTTTPNGQATTTLPVSNSLIIVASPLPNSLVKSPFRVTGQARGNWYFEASFPLKVLDANGVQIGMGHAEAQGDWMTTEFVPFVGSITFSASTTPTGTIVFEKDNPSGLPEHADEVRVPVRFR